MPASNKVEVVNNKTDKVVMTIKNQTKKRIAFLIYSLSGGGAERVVSRLTHILSDEYDCFVFVMSSANAKYQCSCPIIDIGSGTNFTILNELCAFVKINSLLKKYSISTLISFLDMANLINSLVVRGCRRIISFRSYNGREVWKSYQKSIKNRRARLATKLFYGKVDCITTQTELGKASLVRDFFLSEDKIYVVPNPYDVDDISRQGQDNIDSDIRDFISSGDTSVCVGRMISSKNYPLLLEAFKQLYGINNQAKLLIIGDGKEHGNIESFIEQNGLQDCVKVIGFVKNPAAYMSRCKLFITLSGYEGFPNVLVEAMACGIPVMHSDCLTGPRDILTKDYRVDSKAYRKDYMFVHSTDAIYAEYGVLLPNIGDFWNSDQYSTVLDNITIAWNRILTDKELQVSYGEKAKIRARDFSYSMIGNIWKQII